MAPPHPLQKTVVSFMINTILASFYRGKFFSLFKYWGMYAYYSGRNSTNPKSLREYSNRQHWQQPFLPPSKCVDGKIEHTATKTTTELLNAKYGKSTAIPSFNYSGLIAFERYNSGHEVGDFLLLIKDNLSVG